MRIIILLLEFLYSQIQVARRKFKKKNQETSCANFFFVSFSNLKQIHCVLSFNKCQIPKLNIGQIQSNFFFKTIYLAYKFYTK